MRSARSLLGLSGIVVLLLIFTPACNKLYGGGGGGNLTITVTADGNITQLLAGLSVGVSANVMHAGGNSTVTWSITGCSTDCGSLSNIGSDTVVYTAPSNITTSFTVSIMGTAVADTSKYASATLTIEPLNCSTGNEALLNGQYAFALGGASSSIAGAALVQVGSFTADGTGKITTGEEDGAPPPASTFSIQASGSSYSLGSDDRGCMTLLTSDGTTTKYRFAVGGISSGKVTVGRVIEFDDASGTGIRREGALHLQDATAFTTSTIQGSWAFGMGGDDLAGKHTSSAGTFTATTTGVISSGELDLNDAGTVTNQSITGGVLSSIDSNGRATISFGTSGANSLVPDTVYVVSAQQMFGLATPGTFPFGKGDILKQKLSSFGNGALNGSFISYSSGFTPGGAGPDVSLGLFSAAGGGTFTGVLDSNSAGTFMAQQAVSGTYAVGSDGRTTTTGLGNSSPILYIVDTNMGYSLGTGGSVDFGFFEPQVGGPFSNASLSGLFFLGTQSAGLLKRPLTAGSITFDGVSTYSGTEDESTGTGLVQGNVLSNSYAFSTTSAVVGRGTLDSASDTVAYIISPTKLVFFSSSSATPSLTIMQK